MGSSMVKILAAWLLLTVIRDVSAAVSCLSGDTAGVIKDGKTCAELVTSSTKRECYENDVETSCCDSCNAVAITIPDCAYGDRVTGCLPFTCSAVSNPSDCCETCYVPTTTTSTTSTTAATTSTTATSTTTSTSSSSSTTTTASTTSTATISTAATTARADANLDNTPSDDNEPNVGAIVGGVIGGLAGTAIVGAGIYAGYTLLYKKSKQHQVHHSDSESIETIDDNPLPLKRPPPPTPPIIVTDPVGKDPLPHKGYLPSAPPIVVTDPVGHPLPPKHVHNVTEQTSQINVDQRQANEALPETKKDNANVIDNAGGHGETETNADAGTDRRASLKPALPPIPATHAPPGYQTLGVTSGHGLGESGTSGIQSNSDLLFPDTSVIHSSARLPALSHPFLKN